MTDYVSVTFSGVLGGLTFGIGLFVASVLVRALFHVSILG